MFDINLGLEDLIKAEVQLTKVVEKQIPFALARTLTEMAKSGQASTKKAMPSVFDRPTKFTENAFAIRPARKTDLEALVFAKDRQQKYLSLTEKGGVRRPGMHGTGKRAIVTPAAEKLNKFGNLPRGKTKKLLGKKDVFTGKITFKRTGQTVSGIWQRPKAGKRRNGKGYGTKGPLRHSSAVGGMTGLKLLVKFQDSQRVKPRLKFEERMKKQAGQEFEPTFLRNMAKAVATARR